MISQLRNLPQGIKQYLLITANYWTFTLTDGALRMLVVLYFHHLGYSPFEVAMLFLFYEIFGVVTNLFGGYLGARIGLNKTMNIGLILQVVALSMLMVPDEYLSVALVMLAQAFSGIAKDLNKMSAKSAIKLLVPKGQDSTLYIWVARLTGSKNALKGLGFFLGGVLLTVFGFQLAMGLMAATLFAVWLISLVFLKQDLGKKKQKPKFSEIFSKSSNINYLSAARLFLFASRDVWFVVALPVYLSQVFDWDHWWVGGFMAIWVIGYGIVQALAPKITGTSDKAANAKKAGKSAKSTNESKALTLAMLLAFLPAAIALGQVYSQYALAILLIGLCLYAVVFALNSSLHSFLIVHYADGDGVSLDVGFYYMANAMGRLIGTVLSGWVYQQFGLVACLLISTLFILIAAGVTLRLRSSTA